jgi:hypothetical protein
VLSSGELRLHVVSYWEAAKKIADGIPAIVASEEELLK